MRSKLNKLLFKLARSNVAGYFIGFSFQFLPFLIPVRKVVANREVLSFAHPKPFWEQHYLVVPKRRIPALMSLDLDQAADRELLHAILLAAEETARLVGMQDYSIVVNGEEYQDVPQLHFHVAAGRDGNGELEESSWPESKESSKVETAAKFWNVYRDHFLEGGLRNIFVARNAFKTNTGAAEISELFELAQELNLTKRFVGFSVRILHNSELDSNFGPAVLSGQTKVCSNVKSIYK